MRGDVRLGIYYTQWSVRRIQDSQSSVLSQINRSGKMAPNNLGKIFLIVSFVRAPVFGWPRDTTSQLELNSGNSSYDSVKTWCPTDVRAFAGYPSKDCPTPSHYYKCIDQQAFVEICTNSEIYDPILNGCSKGGQQERRKRSLGKGSLKNDKTRNAVDRDKPCLK